MSTHTHAFAIWPFPDAVNTATFCTERVAHQRFAVLQVSHEEDGDWQFLDATTEDPGKPVMLCLGCVFERDASLAQIADLPRGWSAFRPHVGAEWERWREHAEPDDGEQKALDDIVAHGLHIIHVMEEDGLPPFSYSIGIGQSLGMPELIVIGLKHEVAQAAINECYRQMKTGTRLEAGVRVADLLGGGFECVIGEVAPARFREYMGWAIWLYKGEHFHAHQIIYPTTSGAFPWEAEASEWFKNWQPLLDAD
jgi:hypothetical protein